MLANASKSSMFSKWPWSAVRMISDSSQLLFFSTHSVTVRNAASPLFISANRIVQIVIVAGPVNIPGSTSNQNPFGLVERT